jgi:RimJ/RimL family protein N-acetyltransferase
VRRLAALTARPVADQPVPRPTLAIADLDTDAAFGFVSWYFESRPTDWRRMGIVVFDDTRWGGGVGSEALRLWTTYLFDTTDTRRLDFATYSGNPAMCAIGRRLGFVEEARFREARAWAGEVHDGLVYGVLRAEWERAHPATAS